jgi:DNA-directed RNA polymerase subunit E"
MAKKKACRKCKKFVSGSTCPICKGNSFNDSWQGRLYVVDVNKSIVAEKVAVPIKGEYAIKVR